MSYTLDSQREFFGITCDTANDVLKALASIRNQRQEQFFASLRLAVDDADIDLICGHIDWARAKLGDGCMGSDERSEVRKFYKEFIGRNPTPSDDRASLFISEAFDEFAQIYSRENSMKPMSIIFAALLVTGCATPVDDLMNNKFAEVVEKPVKNQYVGVWTGSTGPWLTTMAIKQNGAGTYCSSWNQRNFVGNLKVVDDVVNFQDGAKLSIAQVDGSLTGSYLGSGDAQYKFMRDSVLKEASPYCKTEMSR